MQISLRKGLLEEEMCDVLIINACSDSQPLNGAAASVDAATGGLISTVLKEEGYKAGLGQTIVVRTGGVIPAKRVVVVGLGPKKEFQEETARVVAAAAFQTAKAVGAKTIVSVLHGAGGGGLAPKLCGKAAVEGVRLAAYGFGRYKKESGTLPKSLTFVVRDGTVARSALAGMSIGELGARGTMVARDLVSTPASHMRPIDLVEAAQAIAKATPGVRVKVYDRERLGKMGAGGLLGIAQGSEHPPYLVHLTYTPRKKTRKSVALVGKAITFDSGGLSLKPANSMATMKCDMAGAAAVLGVFSVIGELTPGAVVHGIFGACENMPSGTAVRPGDVVTIMNGKTVEILNTDAEGRVTLADTLTYATKQKPDAIIDLATLTGACIIALGEKYNGLMSNDRALAERVLAASKAAGENTWELPLAKEYKELIKSDVADLKNDAPRWGGALTAGLFLEEFVAGVPWVHLDIAGPAFAEHTVNAYTPKGGTGAGVRMLLEYLRNV
jgi:leucyl aminopeptidase